MAEITGVLKRVERKDFVLSKIGNSLRWVLQQAESKPKDTLVESIESALCVKNKEVSL
jgi:hypothetical protein